jgi:hypothetical protein
MPDSPLPVLTARECQRLGFVDAIVPEPAGGAHTDHQATATALRGALLEALASVRGRSPRRQIEERSRRVRHLGQNTPEGRAATRREVVDLQELHRNLARSLGEWRDRWEARLRLAELRARSPLGSLHAPRTELGARLAARRAGHGNAPDVAPAPPRDADDE